MDTSISERLETLSAWIEEQRLRYDLPGIVSGLILEDGLVWSKGFGYANQELKAPFTADTTFRVASISKLFTATAIMQLRDRGKINLDTPVVDYLPWLKIKQCFNTSRPITIKQLLTHTSGLSRESGLPYWNDYEQFPTLESLKAKVSSLSTCYPPDTQYKYSNFGSALLGAVIEATSGRAYADFLQSEILTPLGMENTLVYPQPPGSSNLAQGYYSLQFARPRQKAPFLDCRAITPAANLASSVSDLAKFVSFHFGTKESAVLNRETREEMHRVHWLNTDWLSGRGLGFAVRRIGDVTIVGHEGWVSGYRSHLFFAPEERFGFVLAINADDIQPGLIYERAVEWLTPAIRTSRAGLAKPKAVANTELYSGRFRNSWGDTQVTVMGGELYYLLLSDPDPLSSKIKLAPAGEHTFRLESTNGSPAIGELAHFEIDQTGKVFRLKVGDTYTFAVD